MKPAPATASRRGICPATCPLRRPRGLHTWSDVVYASRGASQGLARRSVDSQGAMGRSWQTGFAGGGRGGRKGNESYVSEWCCAWEPAARAGLAWQGGRVDETRGGVGAVVVVMGGFCGCGCGGCVLARQLQWRWKGSAAGAGRQAQLPPASLTSPRRAVKHVMPQARGAFVWWGRASDNNNAATPARSTTRSRRRSRPLLRSDRLGARDRSPAAVRVALDLACCSLCHRGPSATPCTPPPPPFSTRWPDAKRRKRGSPWSSYAHAWLSLPSGVSQ